jgi:hypothetical protein
MSRQMNWDAFRLGSIADTSSALVMLWIGVAKCNVKEFELGYRV